MYVETCWLVWQSAARVGLAPLLLVSTEERLCTAVRGQGDHSPVAAGFDSGCVLSCSEWWQLCLTDTACVREKYPTLISQSCIVGIEIVADVLYCGAPGCYSTVAAQAVGVALAAWCTSHGTVAVLLGYLLPYLVS